MNIRNIGGMLTGDAMKHFIMSTVLYFIMILPYKYLFAMIPGNEAKTAAFLPAVLGLLWGPAGAAGVAAANFTGDLFAGSVLYDAITGSAANFFQAYIPYKLWYTFRADARTQYFLYDSKSVLKYAYILFVTSLVTNAMIAMAGESSHLFFGKEVFLRGFMSQFAASMVFGLPLLLLFSNKKMRLCLPHTKKKPAKGACFFSYDSLLYLVVAIEVAYVLLEEQGGQIASGIFAFFCWIMMFLLLCIFMLKPVYDWRSAAKAADPVRRPMFARVVWASLLVGGTVAVLVGCMLYGLAQQNMLVNDLHTWRYLYANLDGALYAAFFLLLFFLWRIERIFVQPIRDLTGAVRSFSSAHRPCAADWPGVIGVSRQSGDEMEQLAGALRRMARTLHCTQADVPAAAVSEPLRGVLYSAKVQRLLLPDVGSFHPGKDQFDLQALLCPGQGGGHCCAYDFFVTDAQQLVLCVTDISDEVQPLLYVALMRSLIRSGVNEGRSPKELLAYINEQLYEEDGAAASAFIGMSEVNSGKILCASAGNIMAALSRHGKAAEWANLPSGERLFSARNPQYDEFQVLLGEGDCLFLCANADTGGETGRVLEAFNECRAKETADSAMLRVIAEQSGRDHDAAQNGDLAMLMLKRVTGSKKNLLVLRRDPKDSGKDL